MRKKGSQKKTINWEKIDLITTKKGKITKKYNIACLIYLISTCVSCIL